MPEGSALDLEAYERGTSVYFPERAVHMFPSDLSTGLCSLKPHVDRLTQSCLMEVDRRSGAVVRYELHDGVIHSDARMTYTDVDAIVTRPRSGRRWRATRRSCPMFDRMHELFEILHGRRRRRGSIDFDLKESQIVLDDQGMVEAIVASERNVAHRIIEEFMLLANETVAERSRDARRAVALPRPRSARSGESRDLRGVHRDARVLARRDGRRRSSRGNFQRLVEKIQGTPEEKPIAFLMLRTMQKARYDPSNLGHFGLAARLVHAFHVAHPALSGSGGPSCAPRRAARVDEERRAELIEDMPEMARHTSERERRASDAERELVQWKKVRFMADKVGDEFNGYMTGVSAFGLFMELVEHFVEGMVHVSTMADDYYVFVERAHILRGERNDRVYRLGDRVTVQVIRVDLERRQIDLGLSEILDAVRGSRNARSPAAERAAAEAREKERGEKTHGRGAAARERAFARAAKRRRIALVVLSSCRRATRP